VICCVFGVVCVFCVCVVVCFVLCIFSVYLFYGCGCVLCVFV